MGRDLKVHSRCAAESHPESPPSRRSSSCPVRSHPAEQTSRARPTKGAAERRARSPALGSGLHSCCSPAWAVTTGPPAGRSLHGYKHVHHGCNQSPVPANTSGRGGKSLFLLPKGTCTAREAGAVAQTQISAGNLQLSLCSGDE